MPARKDTPAARAALARRRQRAAHKVSGDGGSALATEAAATAARPQQQKRKQKQRSNLSQAEIDNAIFSGLPVTNNTIAKPPKEEKVSQYARPMPMPKVESVARVAPPKPLESLLLAVGEAMQEQPPQPRPPQRKISYDVRTETPAGLTSTPSTLEDFNIEAVLKQSHSVDSHQTTDTYERISNFGSVKITSPQPVIPDRRALPRMMPSPKRAPQKPEAPQVTESSKEPTPKAANTTSSTTTNFAAAKPQKAANAKPKQNKAPKPKPTNYNRTASPNRPSRIPTKVINPDAGKLLPRRRSPSPARRAISPEQKLSPRRFQIESNNNNSNKSNQSRPPPAQPPAHNTTRKTNNNREKSKPRLRKPETAVESKPAVNKRVTNNATTTTMSSRSAALSSSSTSTSNSISPFRQFPPSRTAKSPPRETPKKKQASAQKVDGLSDMFSDSFSIGGAILIPDPALQSQHSRKTNVIQLSPHMSPQHGQRQNDTSSPFVIRQNVSFRTPEMERSDENDAKGWNVRPQKSPVQGPLFGKSPTKDRGNSQQVVDAACLQSGDYIMLRSCSKNATLNQNDASIGFNGLCLGKDQEMLRIVKAGGFNSLMYGDIVVLESWSSNQSKRVLGARKRKNHGDHEIAFLDAMTDSSRWMVRSAVSGTSIVVGRGALSGENLASEIPSPVQSGNSISLLNCSNGGLLSIRDGVAVLLTDSYDPNKNLGLLGRRNDQFEPSTMETFQFLKVSTPPCPTWVTPRGMGGRYFLNGSYLGEPFRNNQNETMMVDRNLPMRAKENILVDEVIGSFLGLEGVYVKLKENEENTAMNTNLQTFQLFGGDGVAFDLSLRNLVEQILPLSTSYVCVRDFIGMHYPGYEYGRVMQAFCEGLDFFLQQFVSFVAGLEQRVRNPSEALTMKSIHFEITPLLHSMSILENTAKTVCDKKGGALINALRSLEKSMYIGDTVAKDLLGQLLDRASVPYAETLSIWLQSGRLHDPYEEFMIQKTIKNGSDDFDGDTWAELFAFNEEHVIRDICNEKLKKKILVTGKYWNAVQACIVDNLASEETSSRPLELKKLQFQSDLSGISAYIHSMYESASSKLMSILRDQFHLIESLQIMKRYFLLDRGDFLVNFLDATGTELSKRVEDVSIGRVQHLLGNSIHLTESLREDELSPATFSGRRRRKLSPSNLRCKLSEQSLVSYLDSLYGGFDSLGPNTPSRQKYGSHQGNAGFDFFEIDFTRVPFPISLIITPTCMENYKLLFRHLFFAKHVERRLVGVWSDHQVLKKLDALRGLLGPTFLLRQRMQHCVQNLMNYMSFEIVESNWLEMMSSIDDDFSLNEKQQTVDDLLAIHDGFLQKTMDSCLLTNPILIKTLIKLLNTCLLFTDQMKRFMDTTKIVSVQPLNSLC